AHIVTRSLRLSAPARVFAFAVAWSAAEWVRGHAFGGFPWNLIGYAWSGGFPGAIAVLQSVAWVGIYGLGFATVLAASLPALFGVAWAGRSWAARRCTPAVLAGLLLLGPAAVGAARLARSPAADSTTWLRLVQPSIAQNRKWEAATAAVNFRRLIALSTAPQP